MKDKATDNSRVPLYAWYRFPVDIADDPIVNFIVAEMGTEGFGRFVQFSTQLISQLREEHAPIVSELSINRWCSLLGCKQKGLIKFLNHLQNEGHLSWEQKGNILRIDMPKLREVFDLSVPSRKRKLDESSPREEKTILEGEVYEKEEDTEAKIETETRDTSSLLSDKDFDRLKLALSKPSKEAIAATAAVIESLFSRIGKNEDQFSKIQLLISKQFDMTEKSKQLGSAVLVEAKRAYHQGIKYHDHKVFAAKSKAAADARSAKFKSCPTKTDSTCNSTMRRLADAGSVIEAGLTVDEVEHFVRQYKEHWGEEETNKKFDELIKFLEAADKKNLQSSTSKKRTLPGKIKTASAVIDDEEDDPLPGKFRKIVVQEDDESDYEE